VTARPNLRAVVEGETGELFAQPCPRCIDVELQDLENAERRIRKLEREKKALQEDKQSKREQDPQRKEILERINKWRELTGHPKANINAADRFDHVKARLAESYKWEAIDLAIEGIAEYPYVGPSGRMKHGKPSQRHDRLGICLGSGEALERFAVLGHQARKERDERHSDS
jgi:hypothetical protein